MQLNQHLVISTYLNILNKAWYAEQQQGHVNYLKLQMNILLWKQMWPSNAFVNFELTT